MANLEDFGSYDELLRYYNSIEEEIDSVELLLKEREFEVSKYYRNLRIEVLKEVAEKAKNSKSSKKSGSVDRLNKKLEKISKELIEYKNSIIAEWKANFYGDEELYCYLEFLKSEKCKLEITVNQGRTRFIKNVVQSITKNYIFERIKDHDELTSYMDSLETEKINIEEEMRAIRIFIKKSKLYSFNSKTGGEKYRIYLQEDYFESETFLALRAALLSVEYELRELSGIANLIKNFKATAESETEFLDSDLEELSEETYQKYRKYKIRKYISKRSIDVYNRIYNQEIVDNKNACMTLEKVLLNGK